MLASETGRRLMALSGDPRLDIELVNDAYKPRMHKLYAMLMPAVQVHTLTGYARYQAWPCSMLHPPA